MQPGRYEELQMEHPSAVRSPQQSRDMTAWDRHWLMWRNELKDKLTVLLPPEDGVDLSPEGDIDDFAWFRWGEMTMWHRLNAVSMAMSMVPIRLCTPIVAESHYHPVLFSINMLLMPTAFAWIGLGLPFWWSVVYIGPVGVLLGLATFAIVKDEVRQIP